MNDKTSQFSAMDHKKGHNIVNDSLTHKPDLFLKHILHGIREQISKDRVVLD